MWKMISRLLKKFYLLIIFLIRMQREMKSAFFKKGMFCFWLLKLNEKKKKFIVYKILLNK